MKRYFKGWYFKAENSIKTVAFIPAMHIDERRRKSASLQIITQDDARCLWFPYEQFACHGNSPEVTIGKNTFSERGLTLHIDTEQLSAAGELHFGPPSPIRCDIMGPFRYVPFMQCRHSVFSMTHRVDGCVVINGKTYAFDRGVGYMEGDRGTSFPRVYAWTQCNFFDQSPGSLMLSAAEIPFGGFHFTGIIGVILWRGREIRIATYLGAKAARIQDGELCIRQGKLRFTAKRMSQESRALYAPVGGNMERMIHESLSCAAYYCLEENGQKLFEFQTDRAAFEYEYDD